MKWTLKIGQDDKLRTGGASKRTAEVSPMPNKRKRHTPEFKAKVSLDAIKGMKTASELASQYQVHPVQISTWEKQAIEHLPEAFKRSGSTPQPPTEQALTAPLYEEIGRLKMELDWLKKVG